MRYERRGENFTLLSNGLHPTKRWSLIHYSDASNLLAIFFSGGFSDVLHPFTLPSSPLFPFTSNASIGVWQRDLHHEALQDSMEGHVLVAHLLEKLVEIEIEVKR